MMVFLSEAIFGLHNLISSASLTNYAVLCVVYFWIDFMAVHLDMLIAQRQNSSFGLDKIEQWAALSRSLCEGD